MNTVVGSEQSGDAPAGGGTRVYTRNATGLVREVRLVDQVVYNHGSVTPLTSALAVGLFTVAAFPRMNIYLALLIPALLAITLWIAWSLLTATFPKTGGDYIYNSRILHPAVGWANLENFHPDAYLGFLVGMAIWAALERRWPIPKGRRLNAGPPLRPAVS